MKVHAMSVLVSASLVAAASTSTVHAQNVGGTAEGTAFGVEEVVVTARRRDERLIDVPVSVNAVTAEELSRLNLRQFEDIKNIVPGLSLNYSLDGTGASASIRGVKMDVAASGLNGTVEFYLNDTPIAAEALFPLMYDLGQIEVLRGPQGTLRGRASPSGSITVTTRRPDLDEFGGYVSATGTDLSGISGNGAVNIPIVEGKLAMRIAAGYDDNEFDQIESAFGGPKPNRNVESGRFSLRYDATDTLSFDVTYQKLVQKLLAYDQYESTSIFDGGVPTGPVFLEADDRKGLTDTPIHQRIEYDNVNWRAQWAFAGQRLNYAGAYNERQNLQRSPTDGANFFGSNAPAFVQNLEQGLDSQSKTRAHELRLSSEERVFGMFDYIVGAFYQKTGFPTKLQRNTPVFTGPITPTVGGRVAVTPITRDSGSEEKSAFANLAWHVGDKLEIAGGVRYIDYESFGTLRVNNVLLAAATEDYNDDTWIYTGSVKYSFTDDLMVYASTGTSWRPGIAAVGDFSLARTPFENSFIVLPPEESESYELGVKFNALENRLQTSLALFHQEFDNYPYRAAEDVFFREIAADTSTSPPTLFPRVNSFNFVAAVPAEVNGIEAQIAFAATPQWDVSLTASYAEGKIKNGVIPCNDYFPRDGVPDSGSAIPTLAQIAATGDVLAACQASFRASNAPLFSGNVQSEFRLPVFASMETFVRGLVTYNGNSQNDPSNAIDDVSNYALLNLYLGLRSQDGTWEVTLYGKNVTDTERVLRRDASGPTLTYNIGRTSFTGDSPYRRVSMTEPREFGLNVRYAFGSR